MSVLLSIIIAIALLFSLLRMWLIPRWRWLLSLPFWIYLAWTQWFGGEFHFLPALGLLTLLWAGRLLKKFDAKDTKAEDTDDDTDSGWEDDDDDDDLKCSLHVASPDPTWRSRFPDEEAVRLRLQRRQRHRGLSILREQPGPWFIWPTADITPEQRSEIIGAFLDHIDAYTRGERDLSSTFKSLDHLGCFAPDLVSDALRRIIDSTPDSGNELLLQEYMGAIHWSRHGQQPDPPANLSAWVRQRLSHPAAGERLAAVEWLIRHQQFDWEKDLSYLQEANIEFLTSQIYWQVPVEHRLAVFRIFRKRYLETAEPRDWKTLQKPLWHLAARLKLTDYRGDRADEFSREASDFLTREMRQIPLDSYTDYDMRQLWEAHARGTQGACTEEFLLEMTTHDVHEQVANETWAALVCHGVEGATDAYLERFKDGQTPHGADIAMTDVPQFRERARDHLLGLLTRDGPVKDQRLWWHLNFLLRYPDPTILAFCRKNAEQIPAQNLTKAAWKCFPHDGNQVLEELQQRGLLDPAPLHKSEDAREFDRALSNQDAPHRIYLSSDSDEYPPRYDQALQELASLSRGKFVIGRPRQRILPDPDREHEYPRIEVSWYLDDRRCHFLVDYNGDIMNIYWLIEAANRALEETGRPERFFGISETGYFEHVVFGDPSGWIAASREFSFRLFTDPKMEGLDEETHRHHLLLRFRPSKSP